MNYIIKNNLPDSEGIGTPRVWRNKRAAAEDFQDILAALEKNYPTKVIYRNTPLRGRIQVEIDGFYYYVELFIDKTQK